jgi:class 3 adenylate cyclase
LRRTFPAKSAETRGAAPFAGAAGDRRATHATKAVDAARELLRATGHAEPAGPWVRLGAGVHTGRTWFGAVGQGGRVELTAVGDTVNITARLASLAAAGEILVTVEAATAAALDLGSLDRQRLELRGKHQTIDVVRVRVGPPTRPLPLDTATKGLPPEIKLRSEGRSAPCDRDATMMSMAR